MTQTNETDEVEQNMTKTTTLNYDLGGAIKNFRADYSPDVFPQYGGTVSFYRVDRVGDSELVETIPLDFLEQVVLEWGDVEEPHSDK